MLYDLPFFHTSVDDGKDGKDGISPTIAISDITGGHRLTIVDINGSKTVDVMDGETGQEGKQGPAGQDGLNAVIKTATATIDNTSGTPSVKVALGGTELERTFAFSFTGLRGEKGETGLQGIQGERGLPGIQGEVGTAGKSAYEYAKDSGYSETEQVFTETLANILDKRKITLGIHTDNLLYLFIDGQPVGTGIEQNINTNI